MKRIRENREKTKKNAGGISPWNSIRTQLVVYVACLVLLTILACILFDNLFIGKYYTSKKADSLKTAMVMLDEESFEEADSSSDAEEGEVPENLKKYFETYNMTYLVLDENQNIISTNFREQEVGKIEGRLFGYNVGIDKKKPDIIEETDKYKLQKNKDFFTDEVYMEIWGQLSDGDTFIVRTPMASITESAKIANRFFLITGLIMAVICSIIVWFTMKRFTKPISELTELSERMSNLDFEAKYSSGGKDEIGVLGNNFNKMSQELEKAISELKAANVELKKDIQKKEEIDEMRKEFLSNVSHELKTPIALIQGYGEGLIDNVNDDPESRNFYAEVIVDEARKMNTMVRKLLSLNQLEFGNDPVEMECFNLMDVIQGVLQASAIMIEQKEAKVKVHADGPVYVWGDEFKVEQVITNYISNALNHLDGDKIIDVRCRIQDGIVKTSVFNTGEQIPEADLDKIWIKFYKVDKARTRAYGGSGIGLSIVKAIMESMGQACGVKNYSNGVEFWFNLEHREVPKRD